MRVLLLCLLLCALSLSRSEAADTTTIAAFGDSLFAGLGVAPPDAFPAQLQAKLTADGYNVRVINDGITGDTTSGGLARIRNVFAQKPAIVILELGANDMLRGFPPQLPRANLDKILSQLTQSDIRVLVIGQKALPSLGSKYAGDFDPMFCALAAQHSSTCYPFYFEGIYGHPELLQNDGLHPNAEGVKIALNGIYPYVTQLLKK